MRAKKIWAVGIVVTVLLMITTLYFYLQSQSLQNEIDNLRCNNTRGYTTPDGIVNETGFSSCAIQSMLKEDEISKNNGIATGAAVSALLTIGLTTLASRQGSRNTKNKLKL